MHVILRPGETDSRLTAVIRVRKIFKQLNREIEMLYYGWPTT